MKIMLQLIRNFILFSLFIVIYPSIAANENYLDIMTVDGLNHFTVELAITPDQQKFGLMDRKHLDPDHGMLFMFTHTQPITMWMKDTPITLDMFFIKDDGTIGRIEENAKPESTRPIRSGGPVMAVLEVAGGTARRIHAHEGDRIIYPAPPKPGR